MGGGGEAWLPLRIPGAESHLGQAAHRKRQQLTISLHARRHLGLCCSGSGKDGRGLGVTLYGQLTQSSTPAGVLEFQESSHCLG